MTLRREVLELPGYSFSARSQPVKLDQNESPYDLPEALKAEVLARLAQLPFNRYPELGAERLRTALAARCAWPEDGVVVAGGSNVLIAALVTAAGLGRTVVTLKPTFSVYALQAKLQGARLVEYPLGPDFTLPEAALAHELAAGAGLLFLAQPAAPTGNLHPWEAVARLAEAAAGNWLMVLDEAYGEFARAGGDESGDQGLALVERHPHLLSLRTFSKALGLAGARLGYALAHPEVAREVQKVILPFSVSALQQAVGAVALEHPEVAEARVAEAKRERERLLAGLRALPGVAPYPTSTNFILFRVADAQSTHAGLLERGVVVRRQDHLHGLEGCLRVSVGRPEENEAFLNALAETLEARGG